MTSPFNPNLPANLPPQGPRRIVYLEAKRAPTILDTKYRDSSYYELNTEWRDTSVTPANIYKLTNIFSKTHANWLLLGGTVGPILMIDVPLGVSPIVPTASGVITFTSTGGTVAITGSSASPNNNTINFDVTGGLLAVEKFIPDTGTSPVEGTTITVTNASILAAGTLANALRSNGTGASTLAYQTQYAGSNAGSSLASNWGVSQYDSNQFSVSSGFVQLKGGTTPAILSLSDDTNPNPTPSSVIIPFTNGNIQLQGHVVNQSANFSTVVGGSNLAKINPMTVSRWIVDPLGFNGTHTTIASAYASASANDIIVLMDGTYTENISLTKNINFVSYTTPYQAGPGVVNIIGKFTMSTASVLATFQGISFQTNSDNICSITGNGANAIFTNCFFNVNSSVTGLVVNSNNASNIYTYNCFFVINAASGVLFSIAAGAAIWFWNSIAGASVSNPGQSTSSNGTIFIRGSQWSLPVTTSSSGLLQVTHTNFGTKFTPYNNIQWLTMGGTGGNHYIENCALYSGTASCFSVTGSAVVQISNTVLNSTNTNVTTGSGTMQYANIVYTNSSSGNNVTTSTALTKFN